MMNTTNAQQVAGTIDKPRFRKRTQVNDWRSMSATDTGLWIPMTRFVTYYVSNQWLETSSPEWSAMVLSNALAGARVASGVMGFRYAADSSGFMRIEEVLPDSPAQRAGLRPDDLVLSIDGKETRPQAGATCIIPGPPGSIAELIVVRNGETNTVPVRRTSLTDFLR
jgi:membrane-associated protease RseP (regulator of RpoE activity)